MKVGKDPKEREDEEQVFQLRNELPRRRLNMVLLLSTYDSYHPILLTVSVTKT